MTRLLTAPTDTEFSKIVQQYEKKYEVLDRIYLSAINGFHTTQGHFGKNDVESILFPYLLRWGRMGRVLGYNGCYRVGKAINELKPRFDTFKTATLKTINLSKSSNATEDLYDDLMNSEWVSVKGRTKRVGPTASAKVLHLALPDLFMIWDRKVRETFNFGDNTAEYLRFLENMQDWNQKLSTTLTFLQSKYKKSCTKLIDEYNWKKCWG